MLEWMARTLESDTTLSEDEVFDIKDDMIEIRQNMKSGYCPYEEDEDAYDRFINRSVEFNLNYPEDIPLAEKRPYGF